MSSRSDDVRAAVMPDHCEPLVPEGCHEVEDVAGHRPFRVGDVARLVRWLRRLAVPAQIGAHHAVSSGESWRHSVPGGVRTRVPAHRHQGRPGSAVPHAQAHRSDVDDVEAEPGEHVGQPAPVRA
jgi:hypothetical protein